MAQDLDPHPLRCSICSTVLEPHGFRGARCPRCGVLSEVQLDRSRRRKQFAGKPAADLAVIYFDLSRAAGDRARALADALDRARDMSAVDALLPSSHPEPQMVELGAALAALSDAWAAWTSADHVERASGRSGPDAS